MLGRRLLVLAVVLISLAVLAASVAPREAAEPAATSAPPVFAPGPAEATGVSPPPDAVPGEPPLRRIDVTRGFAPIRLRVGERVRLALANSRVSSVQVGRDGPIESIDPVSPARFDLLYSTPGRREVRLYGPGLSNPRVIGALEVGPKA